MHNNVQFLIFNTPPFGPNEYTEEKALKYLQYINNPKFYYNNMNNYDIIDYEKLIYIEISFQDNLEIQNLIAQIKQNVSDGYKIKNQYRERVLDKPISALIDKPVNRKGFYGIPTEI